MRKDFAHMLQYLEELLVFFTASKVLTGKQIIEKLDDFMIIVDNKPILSAYLDFDTKYEFKGITDKEEYTHQWANENFSVATNTFVFETYEN